MLAHRPLRLAAVLAVSLALAGCGDSGKRQTPSAKATPVGVPTVPATVFPAPTKSPTAAPSEATPTGSAPATPTASETTGGGTEVKATADNKFDPPTLTVKKGAKVTWNADPGTFHSANSGTPPTVDTAGPIQAPVGFSTYSVTFKKPGTYKYFCQPHASLGMVGEIVVT